MKYATNPSCRKLNFLPGMVVYTYSSRTQKAKTEGLSGVQGQPRLHSEFTAILDYTVRILFQKRKKRK